MRSTHLVTAMALVAGASAAHDRRTFTVLRFNGGPLTKGRMDPNVSPGVPSGHVHTVLGGSGFGMSASGEDMLASQCSTASVKGDNSAYWFPSLYFRDPETGSFEDVDFYYANAYYFFEKTHDDIKAFPVGLQMISGNANTRTKPAAGPVIRLLANDPAGPPNGIAFNCPRGGDTVPPTYPVNSDGSMAGMSITAQQGIGFPDVHCDGFATPLRADIHFPSCYNPAVGLDDNTRNMAWPSSAGNGYEDCPQGWIHVPRLFIEVYWNTASFTSRWQEGTGIQPFVFSNGDVTGYSSHADFLGGWNETLLQHIIDTCDTGVSGMQSCPGINGVNTGSCIIPSEVDEQVDGILSKLPGNNPLSGWAYGPARNSFRA